MFRFLLGGLRHWVIAGTAPGIATQDAADGKIQAFERSVLLDGLKGILRTGGGETASGRRERSDELPIEQYGQQQQPLQRQADDMPEAFH